MAEPLYDEFGNYVGPELDDSDEDESEEEEEEEELEQQRLQPQPQHPDSSFPGDDDDDDDAQPTMSMQVVLAEDKQLYPEARDVYGPAVETLVQDEDTMDIETPIVEPVRAANTHAVRELTHVEPHAGTDFLAGVATNPELNRHVTLLGHMHHGKTSVVDMLVEQTHDVPRPKRYGQRLRFTDTRVDEHDRLISIKSCPVSLPLPNSRGKTYLCNLLDAPGHVNFEDEACASLRISDGAIVVVDAAEGVMMGTRRALRLAVREGCAIILLINKVDRLLCELKLPPTDAYLKLKHTIDEVNAVLREEAAIAYRQGGRGAAARPTVRPVSPINGTVLFASAMHGWSFSLPSLARTYLQDSADGVAEASAAAFAAQLWGDKYFHRTDRTFCKKAPPPTLDEDGDEVAPRRSFVEFALEPLYKLYTSILGEENATISAVLAEYGVKLSKGELGMDIQPLLKRCLSAAYGPATGLCDSLVMHVPSARAGSRAKIMQHYTGAPPPSPVAEHMISCNARAPLMANVVKLFPTTSQGTASASITSFDSLCRIYSGSVGVGDEVRVLGEEYTPMDDEDSAVKTVTGVFIYQARYKIPVSRAVAGMWVCLEGVDAPIAKTATIASSSPSMSTGGGDDDDEAHVFAPLSFLSPACIKIAAEPLKPNELPKMVEGLRKINKSYPQSVTKVEESGEHTIYGTGELYLDCIMQDLRELYAEIEIKVADPCVSFRETVSETSRVQCHAHTPNGQNKLTMIAEPLEASVIDDIESGDLLSLFDGPRKAFTSHMQKVHGYDLLAARGMWAFGPTVHAYEAASSTNVLIDDTLAGEVDKSLLASVKASIVQGFQWGSREGPLCDEPVRMTKYKLLDVKLAEMPLQRGGGQVIPTARRVCNAAFLTARPRLMEPTLTVEVTAPSDCLSAVQSVLARRRGHIVSDAPVAGTPIYVATASLPALESFGFETDLRFHTQGQAMCLSTFDRWTVVPGDPLDSSVVLRPLEPAPAAVLARELMVKTRRRKGMTDDVVLSRYFEEGV